MSSLVVEESYNLTRDAINSRNNSQPCVIRNPNGQLIVFYSKEFNTGNSVLYRAQSSGLLLTAPAGVGKINTSSISWGSTNIQLQPNTYNCIRVNSLGVVSYVSSDPIKNNGFLTTDTWEYIVLGYASTGTDTITYLENTEAVGSYIFTQSQVKNINDEWVWDYVEQRLNSGKEPKVIFDSVNNKILMTYIRDSSTYMREFDLTNPNTYEYINHYVAIGNYIYPDKPMYDEVRNKISNVANTTTEELYHEFFLQLATSTVILTRLFTFEKSESHTTSLTYQNTYTTLVTVQHGDSFDKTIGNMELCLYDSENSALSASKLLTIDTNKAAISVTIEDALTEGVYYLGIKVGEHYLWGGSFETPEINRFRIIFDGSNSIYTTVDEHKSRISVVQPVVVGLVSQDEQPYQVVQPTATDSVISVVGATLSSMSGIVEQQEQPYQVVSPLTLDTVLQSIGVAKVLVTKILENPVV